MSAAASTPPSIEFRYLVEQAGFTLDIEGRFALQGITGVFGPSGSGKTSLLRCMAGLASPSAAYLKVDRDIWEDSAARVRRAPHHRAIAYVFQEPRLFPHLDVRGNLEYGKRRVEKNARSSIATDQEHIIDLLGLGSLLSRRTNGLSGGEAQRVAIGRALLSAPRLILMDEPLASLDAGRKDELLPFIERLHAELTVPLVYVSHNIDEICQLCDQLLVMQGGTALATGDLQSVLMRTDLPVLGGAEAGAVIMARVVSYDAEYDLSRLEFSGGVLQAPARYAIGSVVRVRVRANDISICDESSGQTSILNRLAAEVIAINQDSSSSVLVHLKTGEDSMLARITRRSAAHLNLHPGALVIAQLKSVSVRRS
ncbi:MAG TPA: molybdenum ABC transporter ATP-binding protein [Woeseiaceae bacterium]|nr:molybdenum ABC transporter ATP-binding protein [Woeseiaceae bacterium]